jgi:hypothetical protein
MCNLNDAMMEQSMSTQQENYWDSFIESMTQMTKEETDEFMNDYFTQKEIQEREYYDKLEMEVENGTI